jgi:hypothetical protein
MSGVQMTERAELEKKRKLAYTCPRLTIYGDLRALTLAKVGAKADGSMVPSTKH